MEEAIFYTFHYYSFVVTSQATDAAYCIIQTVLYILCSFIIIVFAYTQPSSRQIKHNETCHFSGMP